MKKRQNTYNKNVRTKRLNVGSKMLPGALLIPVLAIAAVLSLGYLWFCSSNEEIGRSIKKLEERKKDLDRRVVNEEFKWANATSPENVRRLLQRHHLEMQLPKEQRVVRVAQPADGYFAELRKPGTQYANGGIAPSHD